MRQALLAMLLLVGIVMAGMPAMPGASRINDDWPKIEPIIGGDMPPSEPMCLVAIGESKTWLPYSKAKDEGLRIIICRRPIAMGNPEAGPGAPAEETREENATETTVNRTVVPRRPPEFKELCKVKITEKDTVPYRWVMENGTGWEIEECEGADGREIKDIIEEELGPRGGVAPEMVEEVLNATCVVKREVYRLVPREEAENLAEEGAEILGCEIVPQPPFSKEDGRKRWIMPILPRRADLDMVRRAVRGEEGEIVRMIEEGRMAPEGAEEIMEKRMEMLEKIREIREKIMERRREMAEKYEEIKEQLKKAHAAGLRRAAEARIKALTAYMARLEGKVESANISEESKEYALSIINETYDLLSSAELILNDTNLTSREAFEQVKEIISYARDNAKEVIRVLAAERLERAIARIDEVISRIQERIRAAEEAGEDATDLYFVLDVLEEKKEILRRKYEAILVDEEIGDDIRELARSIRARRRMKEIGNLKAEGNGTAEIRMVAGVVKIDGTGRVEIEGGEYRAEGFEDVNGTLQGSGEVRVSGRNFTVRFEGAGELEARGIGRAYLKGSGKYVFKGIERIWKVEGETLVFEEGE